MYRKLLSIALLSSALSTFAMETPKIGAAAPDFSLADQTGKTHKLADFKGKYVVLEWKNHGCPYVVKHYETGNMQKLQKQYRDKGVVWLSVISSAPGKQGYADAKQATADLKKFKAEPTAVLLDADGKVGKAYGATTTPDMYVIDPKGTLIYEGAIDDKATTDKADVASAKNFVTAALDESMAGKPVTISETKSYGCAVKYKD